MLLLLFDIQHCAGYASKAFLCLEASTLHLIEEKVAEEKVRSWQILSEGDIGDDGKAVKA